MELLLIKLIGKVIFFQPPAGVECVTGTPLRPLAQKDSRARNLKGPLFHIISTCLPKVRFDWPVSSSDIHRQQPSMGTMHPSIYQQQQQPGAHPLQQRAENTASAPPKHLTNFLHRAQERGMNGWDASMSKRRQGWKRVAWLKEYHINKHQLQTGRQRDPALLAQKP